MSNNKNNPRQEVYLVFIHLSQYVPNTSILFHDNSSSVVGMENVPSSFMCFSTVGNLDVHLLEVIDIHDTPQKENGGLFLWRRNQSEDEKKFVHIEIAITDSNGKIVALHQTMTRPFVNSTETLNFGEEFIFESVFSTSSLTISLCFMKWTIRGIVSQISGIATIPISRLEENGKIAQWYQLVDPISNEGLRTAVRIMSVFSVDQGLHAKSKQSIKYLWQRQQDFERSVSQPSMENGNDKTESNNVSKPAIEHDILKHTSQKFEFNDCSTEESPKLSQGPDNVISPSAEDEDVLVGVIDYCIILGPSSPYSLRPSHACSAKGLLERIQFSSDKWTEYYGSIGVSPDIFPSSPSVVSGCSSSTVDGIVSPATDPYSTTFLGPLDSESHIWDRFPVHDHRDIEMPSKIEWFACPEGPISVLHDIRPSPLIRTFALCAGDSEEIYGVTITFFVKTSEEIVFRKEDSDGDWIDLDPTCGMWWSKDIYGTPQEEKANTVNARDLEIKPQYIWTAITVCLLLRTPYVQELMGCLEHAYHSCILPNIDAWEVSRTNYLNSYGMFAKDQLSSGVYYASRNDILANFQPLKLSIENILCFLCLECPVPIPQLCDVTITIESSLSCNKSEVASCVHNEVLPNRYCVKFRSQDPTAFPRSMYSMKSILNIFGPRNLLDILCCILSESRILFHSSNVAKLPEVADAFRTLMYPFTWTHVYLPVVPAQLLNLVEAPVPFILGTHSENLKQINQCYLSDVVVIDCDDGTYDKQSVPAMAFPEKEDRWLVMALSRIQNMHREHRSKQRVELNFPHEIKNTNLISNSHLRNIEDTSIQVLVFDVLVHLFEYVPDCLFFLNPMCPVFNRPLFMSEYCRDEYRSALEVLTATNAFHTLTETIQSPCMKFFHDSLERLKACSSFQCELNDVNEARRLRRSSFKATQNENSLHNWNSPLEGFDGESNNGGVLDDENIGHIQSTFSSPSQSLQRTFSFRARNLNSVTNASSNGLLIHPSSGLRLSSLDTSSHAVPLEKSTHDVQTISNKERSVISGSELAKSQSKIGKECSSRAMGRKQNIMEDRFGKFLPKWTLEMKLNINPEKSSVEHGRTKSSQSDQILYDVSDIVNHRLNQYLPFVVLSDSNCGKEQSCLSSIDSSPPINLQLTVPTVRERLIMDGCANDIEKESNCVLDGKPMVGNSHMVVGNDETGLSTATKLALFDKDKLLLSQLSSRRWNIKHIAEAVGKEYVDVRAMFKRSPYSLIFYEFSDISDNAEQHHSYPAPSTPDSIGKQFSPMRSPINLRNLQRNTASHEWMPQRNNGYSSAFARSQPHHGVHVDEMIESFLQKIVTFNELEESYIRFALQQCQPALQVSANRKGVVNILKQAKKQDDHQSARSNVYPLHPTAFDAFSKLFNLILGICFEQEDFITAFDLLEVGGHYFRIVSKSVAKNYDNDPQNAKLRRVDEEDVMEFLSEKVCHHPIYQTPILWKSIMHFRLPLSSFVSSNGGKPPTTNERNKFRNMTKSNLSTIMIEIRSILYMMLGMGVNSARALLFIQGISSDYGLDIDDYFKLQRFVQSLWAQHESHQLQMEASSNAIPISNNSNSGPTDGTALQHPPKKKINIRRTSSMNISDWMEKQGHVEKILMRSNREISSSTLDDSNHFLSNSARPPISATLLASSSSEVGHSAIPQSLSRIATTPSASLDTDTVWVQPRSRSASVTQLQIVEREDELQDNVRCSSEVEIEYALSPFTEFVTKDKNSRIIDTNLNGVDLVKELLLDLDIPELSDSSSSIVTGGTGSDNVSPAFHGSRPEIIPILQMSNNSLFKVPTLSPKTDSARVQRTMFGANYQMSGNHNRSFTTTGSSNYNANYQSSVSMDDCDYSMHVYGYANSAPDQVVDNTNIPLSLYQHKYIAGLDDIPRIPSDAHFCTALDAVSNWMMFGTRDGHIQVVDLRNSSMFGKFKHGNKTNDSYEGITTMHSIPVPCGVNNDYMFFTGCSTGLVKCWTLPNLNQNALDLAKNLSLFQSNVMEDSKRSSLGIAIGGPRLSVDMKKMSANFVGPPGNKLRFKQSVLTLKSHSTAISCLTSNVFHGEGSFLNWMLASGDRKGGVTVVKYDDVRSKVINLDSSKKASTSSKNYSPYSSSFGSVQNRDSCITALAFVNALVGTATTGGNIDPWLALGNASGVVAVLDIEHRAPLFHCEGHNGPVSKLLPLNPNEFLSASFDRSIKLWDIRMKQKAAILGASISTGWGSSAETHPNGAFNERALGRPNWRRCAASPLTDVVAGGWDNSLIISSSADGFIKMWDLRYDLHKPCHSIHGHSSRISSMVWNGNKEFFTSSYDGTVKSWDSISGKSTSILHAFSNSANMNANVGRSLHGNTGNRVLQEGIAHFKMADFTSLDNVIMDESATDCHSNPKELYGAKVAKKTNVLITGGIVGNVKVFTTESIS